MVLTFVLFLPIVKVHGNIDNVVFSSEPSDKIGVQLGFTNLVHYFFLQLYYYVMPYSATTQKGQILNKAPCGWV